MKYRDVRPGDCFILSRNYGYDDVWVVLQVRTAENDPGYLCLTYSFMHNLGEDDSLSSFDVDPEHPVDGIPLFEPR